MSRCRVNQSPIETASRRCSRKLKTIHRAFKRPQAPGPITHRNLPSFIEVNDVLKLENQRWMAGVGDLTKRAWCQSSAPARWHSGPTQGSSDGDVPTYGLETQQM